MRALSRFEQDGPRRSTPRRRGHCTPEGSNDMPVDDMLSHYEVLIHQHGELLLENCRLERQLHVARSDIAELRNMVSEDAVHLEEVEVRLAETLGRLRDRVVNP